MTFKYLNHKQGNGLIADLSNKFVDKYNYLAQNHNDKLSNEYTTYKQDQFKKQNPVGAREKYQEEYNLNHDNLDVQEPEEPNSNVGNLHRQQHTKIAQPSQELPHKQYQPQEQPTKEPQHKEHPVAKTLSKIFGWSVIGIVVIVLILAFTGSQENSNTAQAQPTQTPITKVTKIFKNVVEPNSSNSSQPSDDSDNGSGSGSDDSDYSNQGGVVSDNNPSNDKPSDVALNSQGEKLAKEMENIGVNKGNMDKILYDFELSSPSTQSHYYNEAQDKLHQDSFLPDTIKRAMVNHVANELN